ncbi:hypothetical protein SAMN05446935_6176 [Burkholderia sp. YR290]|nr:hypothetical protein SAMN05446935_6176 [Burkholderia sp. YR290]
MHVTERAPRVGVGCSWKVKLGFAVGIYAALSLILFSNGIASGQVFQPGTDPIAFIWFLKWWPYAITNGLNPFLSRYIWSPIGYSMLWANSTPTLAILMWPVTALLSPETSWNLLCLAAPPLNALSCYLLLSYLTRDFRAAWIGGFIFGFSPYVGGHTLGHISLTFVPLVPLIALVMVRRALQEIGRVRFIAALSAMAVLQFGISMEVLATSAFFGGIAFIGALAVGRSALDLKGLAVDTIIAALLTCVVLTPAFYFLWLGAEQLPDVINSPIVFSNDLLGFFLPMRTILAGGSTLVHLTSKFSGAASEQNGYIGIPLILMGGIALWKMRREPWARVVGMVTVFAAIMSLGPMLWIAGHPTYIPMPGAISMFIPLLKHALPGRFALYTSLGVAVLIAVWLGRSRYYGLAALGVAFIVPNPMAYNWVSYTTPEVFANPQSVDRLAARGAVVSLPYGQSGNANLWQLRADMRFRMAGGYVGSIPRYFGVWPAVAYFAGNDIPSDQSEFEVNVLAFCLANQVGSIVIGDGTPEKLVSQLHELNWPSRRVGNAEVIEPPLADHNQQFQRLIGDVWIDQGWLGKTAIAVNNSPNEMHVQLSRGGTPGAVKPILISSFHDKQRTAHVVGQDGATIVIPPWTSEMLLAKSTWTPNDYMSNGDKRALSAAVKLK